MEARGRLVNFRKTSDSARHGRQGADGGRGWLVVHGIHRGSPLVARFDADVEDELRRGRYRVQLGVAVPLRQASSLGLPDEDEANQLEQIEESISRELGANGLLVGVISTNAMREFVIYTQSPDWVENFKARLRSLTDSHTLQF